MALTRIKVLDANSNINITSANIATTLTVSGNLVAGNVTTTSSGGSVNVPKISSIAVTNSSFVANGWQAVSNTGGYIVVNGSGFVSGAVVLIGTKTASATTFANSSLLRVQVPAQVEGTYPVYVTNPDGGVAINVPGLNYSPTPVWTSSSTLPGGVAGSAISIQLTATDTTSVTYSLAFGSTLPTGLSLSSSGLLSGTVTGISGVTVYTFSVNAVDTYSQNTSQTFSITISIGDIYFPYTSLLLSSSTNSANTSGTSNANTVIDSSYNYNNITRAGNPGQGSFNPFGTTWSNYFDGSTGYLLTPTNTTYNLPNNSSWTVECWVFSNSLAATELIAFISNGTNSWTTGHNIDFSITTSGFAQIEYANGTGTPPVITGTTALTIGSWNHIAFVYNGSAKTIKSFINGVVDINASSMATYVPSASTPRVTIGRIDPGVTSPTYFFNGYISNLHMVKGTEVYTSAFTPPTKPLPVVANTVLLTCQSNRFADANTTSANISLNGTVTVQRFNPFGSNATPYATSSNTYIGSTYFGTTDTLQAASSTNFGFGTGDFTMECWFYSTTTNISAQQLLDARTSNVQVAPSIVINGSNQLIYFVSGGTVITGSTITQNTWNHMALSRISGITKLFLNGTQTGSSYTDSNSYITAPMWIGSTYTGPYWTGYISNVRVIKGTGLYSSNFIPSTAPLTVVANTVLLTCQSTQTVTYDANTTPNSITVGAGTPRPTKSVPFSQSLAGQFNGSTAYSSIPSSANLALGTGDYTLEAWVYLTAGSGNATYFSGTATGGPVFNIVTTPTTTISVNPYGTAPVNGSQGCIQTYVFSSNTWYHIAFTRASSTTRIFVNGTQVGANVTDSTNYSQTAMSIGSAGGAQFFPGYISNLRLVKGTAVYTSNFTPSNTPLTAIANTVLLTCQNGSNSNTFIDNSTANGGIGFTITNNGTPVANVVSMAAPGYSPMPIVDTSTAATTYGGSYYFNIASVDYLSIPSTSNLAFGTGDFCVEMWYYPPTITQATAGLFSNSTSAPGGDAQLEIQLATSGSYYPTLLGWSTTFLTSSTASTFNAWNHLVVCRNGTTASMFLNGTRVATATVSNNFSSTNAFYIGRQAASTSTTFTGYISNLRAVKGSSVYTPSQTTITVPTTPLSPSANIAYSGPANTALLLSGTNAGAYDSTMINEFINVGGVSVTSNVKYGTTSYYFNGTSSYLTSGNSNPNFAFGTGDFTIECWIYTNSSATQRIVSASSGSGVPYELALVNSTSNIYLDFYDGTTDITTGSNYVPQNQWVHLAVTRQSTAVKLFINGAVSGSGTTSVSLNATGTLTIGRYSPSASGYFSGNIQDLRITKGIARYTAAFTPPIQSFIAQ